ncbi:death-associated protein kinase 1-like isoform X3 [Corticium candelabrum]|uniref:death-associated protein kinase 1-like isoform X3 n=1 Tax=Corticium candelabrum TaxID=121492 RepID=UPI002E273281|nr:death-associated protein kinase 1-like isoform X3 [Corticium candelabrum]
MCYCDVRMSERDITTLNSQLVVAVRNNEGDEVDRLLILGASPNACDDGWPVLLDACNRRSYSVCKLLVERGADVNKSTLGRTVLMWVAKYGNDEMVDFLLSSNADAGMKEKDGRTAVDWAMLGGHMSTAGRLVLATQRVENVTVEHRFLVLHWACKNKRDDVIKTIVKLGTEVKDDSGRTLLHYAAQYDSRDVVELLLANKADADASDKDGKRPYQLADGELRRRLRKAIDEQKYAVLFAEGTVRPEIIKLCFIGSEGAGKTTLMEALKRGWFKRIFTNENQADDPDCEEERTIGINVMIALIPGVGLVSLWDHAGQKQFHKTHGLFFSASNSFFILLVSLRRVKEERWCSAEELRDEVQYWLSFLRSSLDGEFIPTVLIMASRGDYDRDGQRVSQGLLQRVLDCIRELFKGMINIIQECLVIDCRRSSSPEMEQLRKLLRGVKQQLEESAPLYPRLCQPVVSKLLPSLRKKQKDPFMEKATLMEKIEQEACPGQEKKVVEKVVGFLDHSGEIAVVGDVAALNPVCLHQYAIGPIVASEDFKWRVKSERNDGMVTRDEAETAIKHYLRDHKIAVQLNTDKVLAINKSLGICFKVEGREEDTYMFPALLPPKDLSVMWEKDESKKVYVGRRQVCSSQTTIFSPSTFCMFQSRVCTTLDPEARLWRDGLILSQGSTVHNLIECLVAMIDPVRSVDFVCRGGNQTEGECISLLDTVMSLWRDMLDSYSPFTKYQTEYLSRKHLEEHKELKQVTTYSEEKIKEAKAKEEGACAAVKQTVGDKLMVESLGDLLVVSSRPVTGQCNVTLTADMKINVLRELGVEASHLGRTFQQGNMPDFESIRNAIVKHCSGQWFEIGLTILGLKSDEIERQTFDKPYPTGKLLALIEARRTKDGGSKTAEVLLRML